MIKKSILICLALLLSLCCACGNKEETKNEAKTENELTKYAGIYVDKLRSPGIDDGLWLRDDGICVSLPRGTVDVLNNIYKKWSQMSDNERKEAANYYCSLDEYKRKYNWYDPTDVSFQLSGVGGRNQWKDYNKNETLTNFMMELEKYYEGK